MQLQPPAGWAKDGVGRILRRMRTTLLVVGTMVALGCADDPVAVSAPLGQDRVAPTRASQEAATLVAPSVGVPSSTEVSPAGLGAERPEVDLPPGANVPTRRSPGAAAPRYTLAAAHVSEAEDGSGAMVPASDPVAVDFDAHDFPPGGFDPVLQVGALRFTRYSHPRIGVLRFILADRALLRGPISVQVGDETTQVRR